MNSGKKLKVGETVEGVVKEILQFGVFVEISPGVEGLLHVSNMLPEFVLGAQGVPSRHVMKNGQKVQVFIAEIQSRNRIRLSQNQPTPQI